MGNLGNDPKGTRKLDNAATDGLAGAYYSLAYRVAEIERHLHNRARWFGMAAVASGETHVADRMAGGIDPFTFTAGDDDFGSWVQILGSGDTPVTTGAAYMDPHSILVTGTNSTNPFVFQFLAGESVDIAAALAAGAYSEVPYISSSNLNDSGISSVLSRRIPVGTKAWARVCCIGGNGSTISAYFGLHEYEG